MTIIWTWTPNLPLPPQISAILATSPPLDITTTATTTTTTTTTTTSRMTATAQTILKMPRPTTTPPTPLIGAPFNLSHVAFLFLRALVLTALRFIHSHRDLPPDDLGLGSDDEGAYYDQNNDDRLDGDDDRYAQPASINVMDLHLARAPDLESTDGEVGLLFDLVQSSI